MRFEIKARSHVGRVRTSNEDAFLVEPDLGLCVVADGMGGQNAGEVASEMMVETVRSHLGRIEVLRSGFPADPDVVHRNWLLDQLPEIFHRANQRIFEDAQQDPNREGMGTTAILLLLLGQHAYVCHVGDSRVYLYRDGRILQVTEDHSLVMYLYQQGRLSREDMATHPRRNVLLEAVGVQAEVEMDTLAVDLRVGDRLVVCTDGLSDMVDEPTLASLASQGDGETFTRHAIEAALARGGRDNVTVAVVDVHEGDRPAHPSPPVGIMQTMDILEQVELFRNLTGPERVKLNRILRLKQAPAGTELLREGEPGDDLFVVVQGRVSVWRRNTRLVELGPNQHFGELALVAGEIRTATVRTEQDTTLLLVGREDLEGLLDADPVLGFKLMRTLLRVLADRLRATSDQVVQGE